MDSQTLIAIVAIVSLMLIAVALMDNRNKVGCPCMGQMGPPTEARMKALRASRLKAMGPNDPGCGVCGVDPGCDEALCAAASTCWYGLPGGQSAFPNCSK